MSEICLDCGTDITGPEVLCELCTKRYVRCKHGQIEHHCEACKSDARFAEAIRLLKRCRPRIATHARLVGPKDYLEQDIINFLSANRGRE